MAEKTTTVSCFKATLERLKAKQASLYLATGQSFSLDEVLNYLLDNEAGIKE